MTLAQAQRRYIDKIKSLDGAINKRAAVGARLQLAKWSKRNGYDFTVVWHEAIMALEQEKNNNG